MLERTQLEAKYHSGSEKIELELALELLASELLASELPAEL